MNENINLCEILKGLEGIELYSTVFGIVTLKEIRENYFRVGKSTGDRWTFYSNGKYLKDENAECCIFPSREQRDWGKFERPIPKGTPMICSINKLNWVLRYYGEKIKSHSVYLDLRYPGSLEIWDYVIPYSKFNPNDIEESLKYNIQK